MKTYTFKPGWGFTLLAGLLMPLFVSLGIWQLHRAEEKQGLMQQREQRLAEPALNVAAAEIQLASDRYRRLAVSGEFDPAHQFLLDNQIFNQQAGYRVLTPLLLDNSNEAVLVNRGWLPVGQDRNQLPSLTINESKARFVGIVEALPMVGLRLKGADVPSSGWPAVVQVANVERLSERLGYRLLPYQLLLPPDAAAAYAIDWKPASLHPETSQGYALQWFSFAAAVLALYLWHGWKKSV